MRHGWRPDCSLELIQASSVVARYRQNFPTLRAGTSPRLGHPFEHFRMNLQHLGCFLAGQEHFNPMRHAAQAVVSVR